MYPRAIEAYEHAEIFRRPLWVCRVAIEAQSVAFFAVQRVEQFVAIALRRHDSSSSSSSSSLFSLSLYVIKKGVGSKTCSLSLSFRALLLLLLKLFTSSFFDFCLFRVYGLTFFFFPARFSKKKKSSTRAVAHIPHSQSFHSKRA
jgi:hypothetical protein